MDNYIKKNASQGIEYIESGIQFNNTNYILEGKNLLNNVRNVLDKGSVDYNNVIEKLVRACTALCLTDSENAIMHLEEGLTYDSNNAIIYNNLGYIYHKQYGNFDKAIDNYNKCFECDEKYLTGYLGIIDIYRSLRHHALELEYCKKGIKNCQESASMWNAYGLALLHNETYKKDGMEELVKVFNNGLQVSNSEPTEIAKIYVNLGHVRSIQGDFPGAIREYILAIKYDKNNTNAHQNILLNVHYFYILDLEIEKSVFYELLDLFSIKYEKKLNKRQKDIVKYISQLHEIICSRLYGSGRPFEMGKFEPKSIDEKIRIGYVSSDLFDHAVSFFSKVLFSNYNKDLFSVYVYSNNLYDIGTIKTLECDEYKCIKDVNSIQASELIRNDKIDILIDLSGHTSGNRLDVFGLNSAPIQLSYMGYPNDIGMSNMNRISDKYTEKYNKLSTSKNMDRLFLCYTPKNDLLISKECNNTIKDKIVIGCFSKLQKINPYCITLWKEILRRIPEAKFVLKSKYFHDPKIVEVWKNKFGIYGDRIIFLKGTKTTEEHMNLFKLLDIHLDTFPYSGTTISTESLYMNVPVLTYSPKPWREKMNIGHVERVTGSILNSMKLNDYLIASDKSEYIKKTVELSKFIMEGGDLKVREKFMNSEITDKIDFMKKYETLLYNIYHDNPVSKK